MVSTSTGLIESKDVRMHFYRTGGNKPPLVLVHGISDDGLCWSRVARELAADYDCVMVDLRGHGKSSAPQDGYTIENLGRELAEFIQKLELHKPIVLGHSMGALTTLVMASLFPALPGAILLEDPPGFWVAKPSDDQDAAYRQGLIDNFDQQKRMTKDELVAEAREGKRYWSEEDIEDWANAKHRFSYRIAELVRPPDLRSQQLIGQLNQISCPALFIAGEPACGALATTEDIDALKKLIPQLQAEKIENAGHSIRRYQFDAYIRVVKKFLAGLSR